MLYADMLQLPRMNPYPRDRSIIVLDNCAIHKMPALHEIVEAHGCLLMFLPPYSPDFNPIEESFSCGAYFISRSLYLVDLNSQGMDPP